MEIKPIRKTTEVAITTTCLSSTTPDGLHRSQWAAMTLVLLIKSWMESKNELWVLLTDRYGTRCTKTQACRSTASVNRRFFSYFLQRSLSCMNEVKHDSDSVVCQSCSYMRDVSSALPTQEDDPATSRDSTAVPWSGRLFGHYRGARRWRCSCLGAKWMSQVQRGGNPGTIHREVTVPPSIAALEAVIREPQRTLR